MEIISILLIGLIIGFQHAFEADHVSAVSTLLTKTKNNTWKAVLTGMWWGIGHTSTLLLLGILLIFFKVAIPTLISENIERLIGLMLIILGVRVIVDSKKPHVHSHKHDDIEHVHIHTDIDNDHKHSHNKRSFIIGLMHGVAGSGPIVLLILATAEITSLIVGVFYILIFGLGSVIGMMIVTFIISGSYNLVSVKIGPESLSKIFNYLAAGLSITVGVKLLLEL